MFWFLLLSYLNFLNVSFPTPSAVNNWITTTPVAGALVSGTTKNDQLPDTFGGARLAGGVGDDLYLIVDSRSTIIENANAGIDSVTAYTNFRLPSNVEILNIQGSLVTGIAADTGSMVSSFGERNVLVSGKGNDMLVDRTANKQNLFQFDASSGKDAIYGFTASGANHDLIRLNYSQFNNFDALKDVMSQIGADVRIDLTANDAILLKNISLGSLTRDNFLLPFSPSNLRMTFDDEFNSLSLQNTGGIWSTSFRYGPSDGAGSLAARTLPGNGELQVYTDATYAGDPSKSSASLGLNPFSIENGVLSVTATKLSGATSDKLWGYDYSSGLLTTEKTFSQTYGYFEIKAELPQIKGMFPAFWLMPTAKVWPPEIDIMESVGENYASGGAIDTNHSDAFRTYFPDGQTGMHTYGLMWTKETITWYVDGKALGSIPTPASMNQPMYMIFNLAVGGDWAGAPNASFTSAAMKVDYVRAYSLDEIGAGGSAALPPPEAPETISSGLSTTLGAADRNLMLTGSAAINGTGNAGDNIITGNDGANKLDGAAGNDTLFGGLGADTLSGGAGNDRLDGGGGADNMAGGAGNDVYVVDNPGDRVLEASGGGTDTVAASINITLGGNIENGIVLAGASSMTGNSLANVITANNAGSQLYGASGNDTLIGGNGNDQLFGGSGYDSLVGGAGNDTLNGEVGADTLVGGAGNDSYIVETRADIIVETADGGYDSVTSSTAFQLGDNVEALILTGAGALWGKGNEGDNAITGNSGANALTGFGGDDWLAGNDGNDILDGGTGNDTLLGGNGNDRLEGGMGNDTLTGGAGADTFLFGWSFGNDRITDFGADHARDAIDLSIWMSRGIIPLLTQTSVGAQITLQGGYSIILDGVDAAHLTLMASGYTYDGY